VLEDMWSNAVVKENANREGKKKSGQSQQFNGKSLAAAGKWIRERVRREWGGKV